ncbi:MAG TPA: hypothetical protein VGG19_20630 [Tepidisphaeraceae bacterium]|jgi:hypothetical protein
MSTEQTNNIPETKAIQIKGCDFVLTKPGIADFGTLSKMFTESYIASWLVAAKASGTGDDQLLSFMSTLHRQMLLQPFSYGKRPFDQAIQDPANLPSVLWICLRQKQPKLKVEQVRELLEMGNWKEVQEKAMAMYGYSSSAPALKESTPGAA